MKTRLQIASQVKAQFNELIEVEEYRQVDGLAQKLNDVESLRYLVTLLCDELVLITNKTISEE